MQQSSWVKLRVVLKNNYNIRVNVQKQNYNPAKKQFSVHEIINSVWL